MLKIIPANKNIKGINILPRKPIIDKPIFPIINKADYSNCDWAQSNYEDYYYYKKCPSGFLDKDNTCKPEVSEIILDNGRWQIIGDRGVHWQPFMTLKDRNNNLIGDYKSLTISRYGESDVINNPPTVAVIYSDGYLRPIYYAKTNEASGWGGSFILGESTFKKVVTPRFYNNIKQVKIMDLAEKNLNLELFFNKNPFHSAKLIFYYDYNQKGIDYISQKNKNELLAFISMYRDNNSFDIELLIGKNNGKDVVYNILDSSIDNISFSSGFALRKHNVSSHNILAPEFDLTVLH
ncbi:MAG: hypothetical protein P9F75_07675 [Candidatus Contendobacter sp.]|nr:hypothetical protein [Candidatus Contendobacter sp.]